MRSDRAGPGPDTAWPSLGCSRLCMGQEGSPISTGLTVTLGYSKRNKERPQNVGRQICKRLLKVENQGEVQRQRYRGSKRYPSYKEQQGKGKVAERHTEQSRGLDPELPQLSSL